MKNSEFDVVIIGAGMAGLNAAHEITRTGRTVAVVEAKEKSGGRIFTQHENEFAFEMGAEFVHGKLPLTLDLLKKARLKHYPVKGSFWQHKGGQLQEQDYMIEDNSYLEKKCKSLQGDKPVEHFLNEDLAGDKYENLRFSLKNYVEGYYAADTTKSSTVALCTELAKGDEEQYRLEEGYQPLVHYLEGECRKRGVEFYFSQPVRQLHWNSSGITVITDQQNLQAKKAMITVSLGVLQSSSINFVPAIPHVIEAANQLGFGPVIKLVFHFEDAFWKKPGDGNKNDLSDMSFLFSEETIPTWWSYYPKKEAVLTGWLGGPRAKALRLLSKDEILQKAVNSLGKIFNLDVVHLQQKIIKTYYHNWVDDPFVCGAYSYEVVNGEEAIRTLKTPVENVLFFAGEGLHKGPEVGTVEAALMSGREMAHNLIASFAL